VTDDPEPVPGRSFLLVGLTGGIASGKSTVSRQLAALGAPVIDADVLAREVVAPGEPAWRAIVEAFGRQILRPDDTLDRARLGAVVFGDAAARARLEAITHPAIRARRAGALAELSARGFDGLVVQDAALLIEVGGAAEVDRLVVVYATPDAQLARLMQRDGIEREEAARRIASQMPLGDKARRAHYVIDNSDSPEETRAQVRALHGALQAEQDARRRRRPCPGPGLTGPGGTGGSAPLGGCGSGAAVAPPHGDGQ
jgi:dephospho-CoA kinase